MTEMIIEARQLGKRYRIGQRAAFRTVRQAVRAVGVGTVRGAGRLLGLKPRNVANADNPGDYHWAVRDVTFDIGQGDVVGLIGRNGAGKSTLLKILSQITEPTEGEAVLRGRVGCLLEVGTGFHPDLSGRENIYLNGAILGMSRAEIREKFDAIVDFSGVEKFLDTPVKRYSSGMQVRLAFAVAAHLEPEILIVDEVLAVGDLEFQKKCLGKMGDVTRHGRTIIFVSHNMASVQSLCSRGIWLDRGQVVHQGDMESTIEAYLSMTTRLEPGYVDLSQHEGRAAGRTPLITSLGLRAAGTDDYRRYLATGEDVEFEIGYEIPPDEEVDHVVVTITTTFGEPILTFATDHWTDRRTPLSGSGKIFCRVEELALNEGDYSVTVGLGTKNPPRMADQVEGALQFQVEFHDYFQTGTALVRGQGHFAVKSEWRFG